MSAPDDEELIVLGLLDPERPELGDYIRLLLARGGTHEEIRDAVDTGVHYMDALAAELLLCPPGERLSLDEAAARSSVEPEQAARWWRALGLPDPMVADVRFGEADVAILQFLAALNQFVPVSVVEDLARVVGSSTAEVAAAGCNALRVGFEQPLRQAGSTDFSIADAYAAVAEQVVPDVVATFGTLLRHHLVASSYEGVVVSGGGAVMIQLSVVFVDVVDFTGLARQSEAASLAAMLSEFERLAADAAAAHGGRLVKLLGDGALLTFPTPAAAVAAARQLVGQRDGAPSARGGVASGPVLARQGDYYGPVVNLAARLAALAEPGQVIVDSVVAQAVDRDRAAAGRAEGLRRTGHAFPGALTRRRVEARLGLRPLGHHLVQHLEQRPRRPRRGGRGGVARRRRDGGGARRPLPVARGPARAMTAWRWPAGSRDRGPRTSATPSTAHRRAPPSE